MSDNGVRVEANDLHIERTFPCSVERLFDCFTDPAIVSRWWGPEGTRCPSAEATLEVGGRYRFAIEGEASGQVTVAAGEYLEIDRPHRLAFTWYWEDSPEEVTRVLLEFRSRGARETTLVLTHEQFPSNARATLHGSGWSSSFEALAQLLAAEAKEETHQ